MSYSDFGDPPFILDLGRGTRIQLTRVHDIRERKPDDLVIPLDYVMVNRGRLSRRAMKKKMTRWMHNALWEFIGKRPPGGGGGTGLTARQRRKISASQRWASKNVRIHAPPQDKPQSEGAETVLPPVAALPLPSKKAYFTPFKRAHLDAAQIDAFLKASPRKESPKTVNH